jgi:hypothetical protein
MAMIIRERGSSNNSSGVGMANNFDYQNQRCQNERPEKITGMGKVVTESGGF